MNIEEMKQTFGDQIMLIGNISNELLIRGTPDEIIQLTKERIKKISPGGGYCLGSGNSVPDWAKFENYIAMIETVFRNGKYPIQ